MTMLSVYCCVVLQARNHKQQTTSMLFSFSIHTYRNIVCAHVFYSALLSRPDSRASTTANSTAPSAETSLSGTSPTPLYSEANNSMVSTITILCGMFGILTGFVCFLQRTFELPPPRAISTSHQTTEPATGPTHKIVSFI